MVFSDLRSVSHLIYYDSSFSAVDSYRLDLSIFRIPRRTIQQMIDSSYSLRDRISVTQKKIRKDPPRCHNVVKGLHSQRNIYYYISTDMFKLKNIENSTVTFLDALSLTQAMMTWLSSRLLWISYDGKFFHWHRDRHCWRHLSLCDLTDFSIDSSSQTHL